jgi:CheY-like chemotaxis protein
MQPPRNQRRRRALHVLVVEPDMMALNRVAAMVLGEGHDVSTGRSGAGLGDRVTRLRPDIVLMDVLVPELEAGELARIASRCRGGSEPAFVVHTKLLKPMLRRLLDVRDIFGIIPKSEDDAEFIRRFRELTDRFTSEMVTETFVPHVLGVAKSGTYAVTPGPSTTGNRARKHG